jgi:hypothetical protein
MKWACLEYLEPHLLTVPSGGDTLSSFFRLSKLIPSRDFTSMLTFLLVLMNPAAMLMLTANGGSWFSHQKLVLTTKAYSLKTILGGIR